MTMNYCFYGHYCLYDVCHFYDDDDDRHRDHVFRCFGDGLCYDGLFHDLSLMSDPCHDLCLSYDSFCGFCHDVYGGDHGDLSNCAVLYCFHYLKSLLSFA